jgi:hypothetical protein
MNDPSGLNPDNLPSVDFDLFWWVRLQNSVFAGSAGYYYQPDTTPYIPYIPPSPRIQRGNCDFPGFQGLTKAQQALFGGSSADWEALDSKFLAGFLNITGALLNAGISLGGLQLRPDGLAQDRLRLTSDSGNALRSQIEQRLDSTWGDPRLFSFAKPTGHDGEDDWGARQNVTEFSIKFGTGDKGAFVDIDLWNPLGGVVGFMGHAREVVGNWLGRRRTDPFAVGAGLGRGVTNYECKK